ncbi:MAG: hypothetical protein Q9160_001284 [Pyrenula sp. 1 TL-2023]
MAIKCSDTKAGTLIGTDRFGNKYFENLEEELPPPHPLTPPYAVRTRWIDYKNKEFDPSQMEPGWHAWMSYMVDKPPNADKILQTGLRKWELPEHRENMTATRAAYRPYNT